MEEKEISIITERINSKAVDLLNKVDLLMNRLKRYSVDAPYEQHKNEISAVTEYGKKLYEIDSILLITLNNINYMQANLEL